MINIPILAIIITLYIMSVAVFIVLENRSPQSTFAWLFLFITLPVFGLIIYIFFGRSWHSFAMQESLNLQEFGQGLLQSLQPLRDQQDDIIAKVVSNQNLSNQKKLLHLASQNTASLLTSLNEVEILQNATAKYPRLLEDIGQAKHHIHLNYYIWTED